MDQASTLLSAIRKSIARFMKELAAHLKYLPWEVNLYLRGHGPCFGIFTHLTLEEKLLLYKLTRKFDHNSVIVEIGSYLGASTTFLAAAAKENKSQVYCVDTWMNEGMTEGTRDTYQEFISNTTLYQQQIYPLRGRSEDIAKEFDNQIDLLFLDGDHSYKSCRADVESWLPKVKNGGIIILHDYGWSEGVQKVVRDMVKPREKKPGLEMSNLYWTRVKAGS
ncbi:MAG: class I SAM-dependent methyltransferase [Anaerolineales bacterium]|nr:class I SAM-dependent methyltransferase [Anaerolineales bacterium]